MRPSQRLVAVAALLLSTSLALTGCIHTDRGIQLNGDGSGSYTLTIGFSEQLVSLASDQISQQMNGFGDKVKQEGGSYRHYDDTGYSYWAYTRPFHSVAQLNQMLQETPSASSSSGSGTGGVGVNTTSTDAFQVTQESGPLTNSFHVTGRMSLAGITPPTTPSPVDIPALLKDLRESFAVTMPGWISSHNGGTVSGNTVTYTVHFGESATIDVTGGGYNTGIVYPAGAGLGILALGGLAGFVFWQLRRRRSPTLAPAVTSSIASTPFTYGRADSDAPTIQ
jgi:hypothetical protein